MYNWKSVHLPEKMKDIELDPRGYAIPFIVLRDKNDKAHFALNDDRMTEKCIREDRCSICGHEMHEDKWMIGGPMSTFHPQGCFVDIPVHKECGEYALKVCPYLAVTVYNAKTDVDALQNQEKFDNAYFINPTQSQDRVPYFVFSKISGYTVKRPRFGERYIYPDKPYLEQEFWNGGKQLSDDQVAILSMVS